MKIFSSGVCGCQGFDLTQGDDYLKIFHTMAFASEYLADADDDTKREFVSILCSSAINDGDHLQVISRSLSCRTSNKYVVRKSRIIQIDPFSHRAKIVICCRSCTKDPVLDVVIQISTKDPVLAVIDLDNLIKDSVLARY